MFVLCKFKIFIRRNHRNSKESEEFRYLEIVMVVQDIFTVPISTKPYEFIFTASARCSYLHSVFVFHWFYFNLHMLQY